MLLYQCFPHCRPIYWTKNTYLFIASWGRNVIVGWLPYVGSVWPKSFVYMSSIYIKRWRGLFLRKHPPVVLKRETLFCKCFSSFEIELVDCLPTYFVKEINTSLFLDWFCCITDSWSERRFKLGLLCQVKSKSKTVARSIDQYSHIQFKAFNISILKIIQTRRYIRLQTIHNGIWLSSSLVSWKDWRHTEYAKWNKVSPIMMLLSVLQSLGVLMILDVPETSTFLCFQWFSFAAYFEVVQSMEVNLYLPPSFE